MHLFTITASCRSIVHSSLFADVAAGEGGGGGLNWGWLTAVFLSVCLSVCVSVRPPVICMPTLRVTISPGFRAVAQRDG